MSAPFESRNGGGRGRFFVVDTRTGERVRVSTTRQGADNIATAKNEREAKKKKASS